MEVPVCRRLSVHEKDGLLRAVFIVHLILYTCQWHSWHELHKSHNFMKSRNAWSQSSLLY